MSAFCTLASLLLSFVLLSRPTQAQTPSHSGPQALTAPADPKRAQKAAARGAKAESTGHVEEALDAYQEAARYAPLDAAIVEHAAELRSRLVRMHTEAAERAALVNRLGQATEELAAALRIDPGNAIVLERLAQMKTMED